MKILNKGPHMKRVAVAVISLLMGVTTIAYGQAAKANVVEQDKRVCVCRKSENKWQARKLAYKDQKPGDFEYKGANLESPDNKWCEKESPKHEWKPKPEKPGPVVEPTPSPLPSPEPSPEPVVEPQIQTQSQNNIVLTPAQLENSYVEEPTEIPQVGGTAKSHK